MLALLDEETRRLLLDMRSECRLDIFRNVLQAEMSHGKVFEVLPLLLDVGQRFAQPLDVPQRLAENASRDPEPGVRLQNLLVLARELPGEPGTREALHTACSDPSPEIRLRAAKELGADGHGVLLELAEGMEDDTASAEAVALLDRSCRSSARERSSTKP